MHVNTMSCENFMGKCTHTGTHFVKKYSTVSDYFSPTVASVGFQSPLVRVREDSGVVFVMVELGNSSDVPFTVLLTTRDNTAAGNRRIA